MPDRVSASEHILGKDVNEALDYDVQELRETAASRLEKMASEQRKVFDAVTDAKGGAFFVDAPGGTGKTFILNTILAATRAQRKDRCSGGVFGNSIVVASFR